MPVDFAARRKQAEDDGLIGGGDSFKVQNGDNRIRLMSECLPHPSEFKGTKTFKWLCYVLDRKDGKLKLYFMPHRIYKAIEALQMNPEYQFFDVPMPYDLTVNVENAGTMEVKYAVIPARKETPLTAGEQMELAKAKPLADIKAKLREKQAKKAAEAPPPTDHDEAQLDENGEPYPF